MQINMTRLFFMIATTVVAVTGVAAQVYAQDFSRAYRYGGGVHIPGAPNSGGGPEQVDIVNADVGIDAGGVLGCSGLDLSSMIKNTFEVGDLAGEFQDYLKNTLATEALSLLYSQPGVSQVLDGMKAVGHARASILQERCNANEIYADVTNQRLKNEAQTLCLDENKDKGKAFCQGKKLNDYVNRLVRDSPRWSWTLHQHLCPDGEAACDYIPNFSYNINDKQGNQSQPEIPPNAATDLAQNVANECIENRMTQVSEAISQKGYAETMRLLSTGCITLSCEGNSEIPSGCADGGSDPAAGGGDDSAGGNEVPSISEQANAGLSDDECEISTGDSPLFADNLDDLMKRSEGMDGKEVLTKHVQCLIGKKTHDHIMAKIATMPAVDAIGAVRALADKFAMMATINLQSTRLRMIADAILKSGGKDSVKNCVPNPDEEEDENAGGDADDEDEDTCQANLNPQMIEFGTMLMQKIRDQMAQTKTKFLEFNEKIGEIMRRTAEEEDKRVAKTDEVLRKSGGRALSAPDIGQPRSPGAARR